MEHILVLGIILIPLAIGIIVWLLCNNAQRKQDEQEAESIERTVKAAREIGADISNDTHDELVDNGTRWVRKP